MGKMLRFYVIKEAFPKAAWSTNEYPLFLCSVNRPVFFYTAENQINKYFLCVSDRHET